MFGRVASAPRRRVRPSRALPPLLMDTPHARAVRDLGGVLVGVSLHLRPDPPLDNGGCGEWTHVAGTNGGMMRCGAPLTDLSNKTAPYYCGRCQEKQ